jgi:hypothetical protein
MIIIGLLVGVFVFFMLKSYGVLGMAIAGFLAGLTAKGPLNGLLAGLVTALLGTIIFVIPIPSPLELFNMTSAITGHSIAGLDPLGLAISIFSITGVLASTIAGAVGGLIRH